MIRNAGGVITEDEIRSAIRQRRLGTKEIMLIHHTDCGVVTFTVRQSMARIQANPFIPHKDSVRGFVYDVATGKLIEVAGPERRREDSS